MLCCSYSLNNSLEHEGSNNDLFVAGATVESDASLGMESAVPGRGRITGIGHATSVVSSRGVGARSAFTDNEPSRGRGVTEIVFWGWKRNVEEKPEGLRGSARGWDSCAWAETASTKAIARLARTRVVMS